MSGLQKLLCDQAWTGQAAAADIFSENDLHKHFEASAEQTSINHSVQEPFNRQTNIMGTFDKEEIPYAGYAYYYHSSSGLIPNIVSVTSKTSD